MTAAAPARWTEQLSDLLLEHFQPAERILLAGAGPLSTAKIDSRRCTTCAQLISPNTDEISRLGALAPNVIVVQDFGRWSSPSTLLKGFVDKFPEAKVLIWFWNSSASSLLLSELVDRPQSHFLLAETQVKAWLSELGLSIESRQAVRAPVQGLLARDAQEGLQTLFEQLNPGAGDDLIVYKIVRARPSKPESIRLISDLLSVLVWVDRRSRRLLDECLFAAGCQSYRPFELIAVGQGSDGEKVREMLEQYSNLEPFEYQVLFEQNASRAEALNAAVQAARGRYLAFLSEDQVVFPEHYVRLIEALARTDAAWAMSSFLRAYLDEGHGDSAFIRWKEEFVPRHPFDLSFFQYNRPAWCSLVIDRSRVGRFELAFSGSDGPLQNDPLFVKLAALFRPAIVKGPASCEHRIASDSALIDPVPEMPRIQVLLPLTELTIAGASRLHILRWIDQAKRLLRLRLPRFYQVAKRISEWCSRLVSGKSLRENVDRLTRGGK